MSQSVKELHEKRMKMWDEGMKNHLKYINPQTELFSQEYVEHRVCPVCEKDNELQFEFKNEKVVISEKLPTIFRRESI